LSRFGRKMLDREKKTQRGRKRERIKDTPVRPLTYKFEQRKEFTQQSSFRCKNNLVGECNMDPNPV